VSSRKRPISKEEIQQAFADGPGAQFPPILNVKQLAALLQISVKTLYEWIAKGRLDGAFRKRGKHYLIWRDRAMNLLFNGPDWKKCKNHRNPS
jgi:excisionase family DNA binding protein